MAAQKLDLNDVLSSLDDIVIVINREFHVEYLWASEENLLSRPLETIKGQSLKNAFSQEYTSLLEPELIKIFKSGKLRQFEYQMPESGRWFNNKIAPVKNSGNKKTPNRVVVQVREITQRKEIQRIRQEERNFANLGNFSVDFDTGEINWSEEVYHIFGLDPDTNPPDFNEYFELVHPDDVEPLKAASEKALSEGYGEFMHRIIRPNGEVRSIKTYARPIKNDNGEVVGSYGSSLDLTDILLAKEKVKEETERLALVKEALTIGVWDWDIEENRLVWDKSQYKVFGINAEDFSEEYEAYSRCLHPEDFERINAEVQETVEGLRENFHSIFRIIRPDGQTRFIKAESKMMRDENGKGTRMMGLNWDVTEQVKAEREVAQQKELLNNFIRFSPAAIAMFDNQMQYLAVSDKWLNEYQLGNKDIIHSSIEAYTSFFPESWKIDYERCLQGTVVKKEEEQITDSNGNHKWLRLELRPWYEADASIGGLIMFTDDITERKLLEEQREQLIRSLEVAKDGFAIVEGEKFIYVNQSFSNMLAYTPDELLGQSWRKLYRDDQLETFDKKILPELKENNAWQGEIYAVKKTGEILPQDITLTDIENNQSIFTFRDNSERDEVLKKLARSESTYRNVVNNVKEVIFKADHHLNWRFLNPSWSSITGFSIEESTAQPIMNFIHKEDQGKLQKLLDALIKEECNEVKQTIRLVNKQGHLKFIEFFAQLIKEESKKEAGITGTLYDVTVRVQYEEELRIAKETAEKASRSKADFLSTMSHEIRTPLNAVIGNTHLLLMEDPKEEQIETLNTLKFSAENLLHLISDILDFNKIEAGKIEFDIGEINLPSLLTSIKNANQVKAREKNIKLNLLLDTEIPKTLMGDATRISQVINNLVSNAVKFTRKGQVEIKASLKEEDENSCVVNICVEDSGIGIQEDQIDKIFDTFSQANTTITREYGGTGLGLSITKSLLELMDSEIKVKSRPGFGSCFEFNLKLTKSKVTSAKEVDVPYHKAEFNSLSGVRVLLVEDNLVNVKLVLRFLEKWDVKASVAENGKEALDCCVTENFDLILMDLQMPIMDGYSATIKLRERGIQIPIVALTASAMLDVREKAYDAGMNDYLTKPFNPIDLYQKIKKYALKSSYPS